MFTNTQLTKLKAKLETNHVSQRSQGNFKLSYIEGWHAIAECNRVFGFGEWDRETVMLECVNKEARDIGANKTPGWSVTYVAKVRITVRHEKDITIREGTGAGHGIGKDLGDCYESAVKEAETDAMKRALMMFGNIFGLALYDKTQANVGTNWHGPMAKTKLREAGMKFNTALQSCLTQEDVNTLVQDNEGMLAQLELDMPISYNGNGGDIKGAQAAIADKLESITAVTG